MQYKTFSSDELSPRLKRLDPAQFMLSSEDRKMSAPAFPVSAMQEAEDHMLPRSPEIENIPEKVEAPPFEDGYDG